MDKPTIFSAESSGVPSFLPMVNFLGVAGKESLDTKEKEKPVEKLEAGEITDVDQITDFLLDMAPRHRKMYFSVKATSKKGAEVKAKREANHILRKEKFWESGGATAFKNPSSRTKIKPREVFDVLKDSPDLRPEEYIVRAHASHNPW